MIKNELIRSKEGDEITPDKTLFITLCGGYYVSVLAKNFTYVETVMHDTNIHNDTIWEQLDVLSQMIEQTSSIETFKYRTM